jgi:hypothetical protein
VLKGELKNNPRKPTYLTKNRHSNCLKNSQLTLSQGMLKKGDEVSVHDDDDACGENQCITKQSDSDIMY